MGNQMSRTKKAAVNSMTAIAGQVVSLICGFILPRLILTHFGSAYNGITSSITQFIDCVILLRAGVGGVTRAALYRPLADNDVYQISGIVNATQSFMKKVAFIFAGALIVFAAIYPFAVSNEFDWLFSASLVVVLGISTFAQNYFGISYQMLIQADQRGYVYTIISIITTILNTIVASSLILLGAGIHFVKLGSAVVFSLNPIVLNIYVRRSYKIDTTVPPNNSAINQRWDAFAQQVAAFVNNNTDLMVLTIFTNLKEVSVYSVYYMIAGALRNVVQTLTTGVDAAFGNMLAKKETETIRINVCLFEQLVFFVATFAFTCGLILIEPFVMIYTKGVTDVNYSRVVFGSLMCINQFFFCIRLPYQMLVEAAGHFKQTRNGAIFEALMNIIVSVCLVIKFGLIGVAIGTFCALVFRTFQYAIYSSRKIMHRSLGVFAKRLILSIAEGVSICVVSKLAFKILAIELNSYFTWALFAFVVGIIAIIMLLGINLLFYKKEVVMLFGKAKNLVVRK